MGERLLCKQEVIGSIPFTSTTTGVQWPARWVVGRHVVGISLVCGRYIVGVSLVCECSSNPVCGSEGVMLDP